MKATSCVSIQKPESTWSEFKEKAPNRSLSLLLDEREEAHKTRALYGGFDGALLLGRQAAFLATHDAAVRIDELLQEVDIFVVDVLDIVLGQNVVGHVILRNYAA